MKNFRDYDRSQRFFTVRFIAANDHPDHDTIAKFRRRNQVAISRAFEQVLRLAMIEKLQAQEAKHKYRKRKQTAEPVFGIIKSVLGFQSFHLRGMF